MVGASGATVQIGGPNGSHRKRESISLTEEIVRMHKRVIEANNALGGTNLVLPGGPTVRAVARMMEKIRRMFRSGAEKRFRKTCD